MAQWQWTRLLSATHLTAHTVPHPNPPHPTPTPHTPPHPINSLSAYQRRACMREDGSFWLVSNLQNGTEWNSMMIILFGGGVVGVVTVIGVGGMDLRRGPLGSWEWVRGAHRAQWNDIHSLQDLEGLHVDALTTDDLLENLEAPRCPVVQCGRA